ncbi:MAG: bifunctional ornithine acetyltransferase/N-acetylglutamate synthase [Spirochaetales bacterium]|nr:bifunctional ornithine acetyltransferase/N-acetylglutamate synthase [Spirochaetales bacterium]
METYQSEKAYLDDLSKRAALPEGFQCAVGSLQFQPVEKIYAKPLKMNLTLIKADNPVSSFGAVFTKNKFPGAPVLIGKKRLQEKTMQAIFVNNKISNVCTEGGEAAAYAICQEIGKACNISADSIFPASTGIIGWKLPVQDMIKAIPGLTAKLGRSEMLGAAQSIMTTDAFPKLRSIDVGEGRIWGIAKGAGMIEPNMATMLVFLLTDLDISRENIRYALKEAADLSFNRISIDSDQSTSDSVIIMSSRLKPAVPPEEFQKALNKVCMELAEDVVRNGEGTGHVIQVDVKGHLDEKIALGIGKYLINSPLVKTAIYGKDPNVGRILMAVGDYLGTNDIDLPLDKLRIYMGGVLLFEENQFQLSVDNEEKLYQYMVDTALTPENKGFPEHDKKVVIEVIFGEGGPCRRVLGSDLTYEYIRENAEYRS